MLRSTLWLAAALWAASVPTSAWDGVDLNTGGSVEIQSGNLVRSGNDIELYDHSTGQYHEVTVEDTSRSGSTVGIEVYDTTSGDFRTLEFED